MENADTPKTVFVWVIDGTRDPCWWGRAAFSIDSLIAHRGTLDFDVKVLSFDTKQPSSIGYRWLDETLENAIITPPDWVRGIAEATYHKLNIGDFCPAVFARLFLPQIVGLHRYERIISVDADAEWVGGVDELIAKPVPTGVAMVPDPYWFDWGQRLPFGKLPPLGLLNTVSMEKITPSRPYHGAGLIVLDTANEERNDALHRRVFACLDMMPPHTFGWPEQDILNVAADITSLDESYDRFYSASETRPTNLIQYPGKERKLVLDRKVSAFLRTRLRLPRPT